MYVIPLFPCHTRRPLPFPCSRSLVLYKQRNQSPAALLKDKHSRSGLASPTERDRKNGAGAHNWGSFSQEGDYEAQARVDAENDKDDVPDLHNADKVTGANAGGNSFEAVSPTASMASFDSSHSAQNTEGSVPKDIKQAPGMGGRRMSNVSDEERDKARSYREGVRAQGGTSAFLTGMKQLADAAWGRGGIKAKGFDHLC